MIQPLIWTAGFKPRTSGLLLHTAISVTYSSFTWLQPSNNKKSAVITLVNILNARCKAAITHSESHTTRAQWVCSDTGNIAIVASVKRLGLTSRWGAQQVFIKIIKIWHFPFQSTHAHTHTHRHNHNPSVQKSFFVYLFHKRYPVLQISVVIKFHNFERFGSRYQLWFT